MALAPRSACARVQALCWLLALAPACDASRPTTPATDAPPVASSAPLTRRQLAALERAKQAELEEQARAREPKPAPALAGDCPEGMQLVDTGHCPEVARTCERDEFNKPNKLTICHRFAQAPPRCLEAERRQRFCIDKFEFPNREGARSPVMVDFHDAGALCAEQGKRLCWESEWTAACEGPDKLPFPYGYARDPRACNIDNSWLVPSLERIHDASPSVRGAELARLDQGVASGSKPGCKSGFGVHDQTGNVDEWVLLEHKRGKGGWAGLKGGAWGHVRNACRPVTTSHAAEFAYYFVSFRCCADAKGASGEGVWKPPPLPPLVKTPASANRGWTPAR